MSTDYELFFLSDLRKKSRYSPKKQQDFQLVLNYIFERIDGITANSARSQFNITIAWIKRLVPRNFLMTLLGRLRYDAIVGFQKQKDHKKVYCMMSFQKHPAKEMIGMFDIYVSPSERSKNITQHFDAMANMVGQMCMRYKQNGYKYIQCGTNDTTRRILRLFRRTCEKKYPELQINVETSRIIF